MIRDNQTSIILITVIWLTAIALTGPNGNFPLNDDWSFGLTAKALFETGRFQPIGWAAMPQLTNAVWGALFLHLGEFSFTLLRFSTLTVSLIGLWAIYLTLKQLQSDSTTATIATLAIAFSPIYYSLSFTFMTDVPFTALIAISSLFYIKTLLSFSWKNYLLATTFTLAAMLSRQLAIAVPLGFMAAFIVNRETNLKNALISTLPFALSLISYFLFRNWLLSANLLPPLFDSSNMKLLKALAAPQESLKAFAANLYVALMYFGLFFSACLLNSIY
ncbi:MAG: glycosyltransferase family 39 protein [Thauera sp.]